MLYFSTVFMERQSSYSQRLDMIRGDQYAMSLIMDVANKKLPVEEASYMIKDHFKWVMFIPDFNDMVRSISRMYKKGVPEMDVYLEARTGNVIQGHGERIEPP